MNLHLGTEMSMYPTVSFITSVSTSEWQRNSFGSWGGPAISEALWWMKKMRMEV